MNETGQMYVASAPVMVSVIIVSWNARDYLMECLASLTSEACHYTMEVIVVDNASSDGSAECVASRYPQVRLVRSANNLGFAKANNLGASLSTGRYLCFINSDIKLIKDCISRLVDYCEQQPYVGIVGPRIVSGDGKMQRSCRGFPSLWNMFCRALALDNLFSKSKLFTGYFLTHWPQDSVRDVDILSGCFLLVRREALAQVGLLDESFFMYGEDMDWCRRFWADRWRVTYVPSAEAIHHGGGSSSNAPVRFYIEKQRADLQYWKKHHSPPLVACFFLISCLHLTLRAAGYSLALVFNKFERQDCRHKVRRSIACLKWMFTGRCSSPGAY